MQQPNAGLGRTNGNTQYRTQSNPFIHIADALTPLTVIQVYAPTNCASPDVKDAFYRQLQQQLEDVPNANLLLLMGDFNAKLGCEAQLWGGAIGRFGLPAPITDNGTRLLHCVWPTILL